MTLPLALVLLLVTAHFVGDFLCQTSWMGNRKSQDWLVLALHVGVYSSVLGAAVVGYQTVRVLPSASLAPSVGYFLAVNAILHFGTDAVTSRLTGRAWRYCMRRVVVAAERGANRGRLFGSPVLWVPTGRSDRPFFNLLGLDQLLHAVALFVTASWWLP
jgi:hypothetical protein